MGVLPDYMVATEVKITPYAEGVHRPGVISFGQTSYGYDARVGYKFKVFSPICATVIDPKNFDPKSLVEVNLTPGEHNWVQEPNNTVRCNHCGSGKWVSDKHDYGPCLKNNPPDHILVPPHSFVLGETVEEFTIPRSVLCVVVGKSTYARTGLVVNVTPGEPEWTGKWTVELSNTTPLPIKVYCGEGIMQCVFFRSDGYRKYTLMRLLNHLCAEHGHNTMMTMHGDDHFLEKAGSCNVSYLDKKGKYQGQTGLTLPKVEGEKK